MGISNPSKAMDQTTDTAGLTETEKYLVDCGTNTNKIGQVSSDSSDDDDEAPPQDALLGGIRTGLNTMTKTARDSLSTCKTTTGNFNVDN